MRSTSMLGTGMVLIGVPLSVGYSLHSLRAADDRATAAIAFALSLVSVAAVIWFGWRLVASSAG
jgi:TRAP-type C4-dicarboxylate transport system permease small subunit